MTDSIQRLFAKLPAPTDRMFVWLVPTALLLAATLFAIPWLRRLGAEWRLRRNLRGLGNQTLRNVLFPDGIDGTVWIEQLSLTPTGIRLLNLKRYPGLIYGAEHIETWTQVVNGRSYPFPNPLLPMEREIMAVRALVPETPISGCVVFSHESEFPKGRPAGVWLLDDLVKETPTEKGDPPAALQQAWATLSGAAQPPAPTSRHGNDSFGGSDRRPAGQLSASILALAAVLWLIWWLLLYPG